MPSSSVSVAISKGTAPRRKFCRAWCHCGVCQFKDCDRLWQVEHKHCNLNTFSLTHLVSVLFAHATCASDHCHAVGLLLKQMRKRIEDGSLLDKDDSLLVTNLNVAQQLLQPRRFLSLPPTSTLSESRMTWMHHIVFVCHNLLPTVQISTVCSCVSCCIEIAETCGCTPAISNVDGIHDAASRLRTASRILPFICGRRACRASSFAILCGG